MDLNPYVDALRRQLAAAADAGGAEARATVEQIAAPLEAAIRLTLLEALSAAADEITRELAPGSVELRLRAGAPEFAVALPPAEDDVPAAPAPPAVVAEDDDSAMVRINLRLSEQLKASVEEAASAERLSVNAWLVRAATAALAPSAGPRPERRGGRLGQSYKGWVQ